MTNDKPTMTDAPAKSPIMFTYSVWGGDAGEWVHFSPGENPPMDDCKRLVYRIQATNWDDAMRQHHERQGWEPYVPLGEWQDDDAEQVTIR